jgi:hypothetical protein
LAGPPDMIMGLAKGSETGMHSIFVIFISGSSKDDAQSAIPV